MSFNIQGAGGEGGRSGGEGAPRDTLSGPNQICRPVPSPDPSIVQKLHSLPYKTSRPPARNPTAGGGKKIPNSIQPQKADSAKISFRGSLLQNPLAVGIDQLAQ
jgi:hypothetical protein